MVSQLPTAGETRWNGQYRLLKIEENFEDVKGNIGMLVDSELVILKHLTAFLKPFYVVTKQLEGEKLSTIQDIIPVLCKLERDIHSCSMPEGYIQDALSCLGKRFSFITEDLHLMSATILSPHGLKWLRVVRTRNAVLKFSSEETILALVKQHLDTQVEELKNFVDVQ